MTSEEYLRKNSSETPDHLLRCRVTEAGVTLYIHPHGKNGDTKDYIVEGNTLRLDPSVQPSS